jgi:hypothetical protein
MLLFADETGWPLKSHVKDGIVRLTTVAEKVAVPPFWTDVPKGGTVMMGRSSCAWLSAAKPIKHITIDCNPYLMNL